MVFKKIQEFNNQVLTSNPDLSFSPDQLENLIARINANKIATTFNGDDWMILSRMVYQWPQELRFPGIDLFRLIVLETSAPLSFSKTIIQSLFPILDAFKGEKSQEPNVMLIFRLYANMFAQKDSFEEIREWENEVIEINVGPN
jgi:hypothetical protein